MNKKHFFTIKGIIPNPAVNYFAFTFISFNNCKNKKLKVSIYDNDGALIYLQIFDELVSNAQYTIKTNNLNNGLYDVEFCIDENKIIRKIKVLKNVLENCLDN